MRGGAELAQHANASGPHPVHQHVLARDVDPSAVPMPSGVGALTRAICSRIQSRLNVNTSALGRLHERADVRSIISASSPGVRAEESDLAQTVGDGLEVAVDGGTEQPADLGRHTVGQPGHGAVVDDTRAGRRA